VRNSFPKPHSKPTRPRLAGFPAKRLQADPAALIKALQARQARIQEELRALEADLQRLQQLLERKE